MENDKDQIKLSEYLRSSSPFGLEVVAHLVLKEVLRYVCENGCVKVDEISRELGIPMGLVEHAIQKLKDMEYLIPVTPSNEKVSCSFCPLKSTCNIKTAGIAKSYLLTKKGRELLGYSNGK